MKVSRRKFLRIISVFTSITFSGLWSKLFLMKGKASASEVSPPYKHSAVSKNQNLGVEEDGFSRVYMVKNASPEQNMKKAIEMIGGIEKIVGKNDIVILKPNAQRFNQGMTNTDAMKGFIDLILSMPNFTGEIIIAENHQIQKDELRGWITDQRNGQFNFNELVQHYQKHGFKNVTKYHWHNAGPCSKPLQGDACCGRRIESPEQGDGYVWMDDCYYVSPLGRKCLMTFPVFTSSFSGIRIDLKNGAWKEGRYLDVPIRLINFSALNHHSRYAGVSASVKNLMGVVDMSCGFHGDLPKKTYNVHHIGVNKKIGWLKWNWRIDSFRNMLRYKFEDYCHRHFHHTGGALGFFMANVRFPDLNIIAADLVGWGDRIRLDKAFKPKALLISKDPVALDYIAAKKILLPGTPVDEKEKSGVKYIELNDPDIANGPFYRFLQETHNEGIGNISMEKIKMKKYDLS